jgi:gliding motility-associated-like protein
VHNKTYNQELNASIDGNSLTLVGVEGADNVQLANVVVEFATNTVATGKLVSIVSAELAGDDANNYTLNTSGAPTSTANITPATLTLSDFVAGDKEYDGTTAVLPGHGFSDNRYSGDNLSFTYDVEFENKNVGIGKDVNFINIAIGGTHAGNYTLASETGTANANITARPITITADDKTKVYGSNDPVFTFGITSGSLATGDALSGSPSRDAGEDVDGGPYAITQGTVSVSDDNSGNNYSIAFENGQLTITKRDLTITPKSLKKVEGVEYTPDGTEFTTSSIYYGDVIASVMLTSTGFSSAAEVGYYNITASNAVAQTGTDLNNYTISYADGTNSLEVTAKQPVTLPNIVASNKVYSGNTTATISSWGSLSGVADGDDVSIDVSTYAATFADRHVGNSKNITIANVLLTGAQAYKYYLEAPTAQANITPANLTLNTFTASNKTYDATTTVTSYSVGGHTLLNAGDEVSFSYTVAFEDKNAGADKTVNFSAITLGGAQASNYNLVTTEGIAIATISKATLTLNNFTAGDKVYDGERSVTGDGFADDRFVIEGTPDDLEFTYSVAFNNKHVGENKPVNYTDIVISGGADKDNYVLASNEGSTTANITETLLTINVDAGQTKVYGGTEPTPYTYGAEGLQGTDDMSGALTRTAGENVGTYAILIGDLVPNDGNSGNNYTVSFNSQNFEITRRPLTLSNFRAEGKVYDQTTDVTGTGFDVNNLLSGDEVIITHSAAFDDKHAGISKPVTFTGIEISGGAQADNYTLETLTGTAYATITQKPLVLSSFSAADKVYDGNTIVSGTGFNNNSYSGDDLDFDYTAVFENEHVGEDKPVNYTGITISGGDDQGNYYLSDNTGTAWANIAPAPLTITVTPGQTKVYGASDPVSFTYTTSGLMVGDGMIGSLSRATGNNVGEYAIAQNTLKADDGNDGNNYSVTFVPANFSITPRALTITAKDILKAQGTEYVFNNADFETTPSPLYYSDAITSVDFACAGAATDAIPGTYAITPSNAVGTGLGNYSISYENGTLTVAENKPLTLSDIVADDKIYDGNTTASISSYGTLSDVVPEHPDVSLVTTAASASFSSKNVGASRTVTITGLSLTGSDADFYIIGNQTTNAAITARDLTLDNFVAGSKIYDGNTNVDGDGFEDDRVGSDELTFSYDVAFTDKNVADGKTVNFNNITISGGADQNNYNLVTLSGTAIADITVRTLELSGLKADNKTYDGNTDVGGAGFSDNRVSGDDLEFSYTADFADKNVANGIAVNYTGISISGGVDKDNYVLDSDEGSTTANITRRDLTLSNFTADGKVYDGNANVLSGLNFTDNRVAGDVLEFSHTATFNNENVGVDKTVNHSISLTGGASAGNYTLVTTTAQTQADITARTLNIDFTASDKTYNATTDVTINATDDRVGGDELGISYTAAFDTRHAGVNKDVNITGITLTGVDKDNYATASEVTVKATINTRPIILTANNSSKTYGAADPAEFSYNINSGNLVGDDTFTGALDRATGEDVGTYAIERGSLAISDENGGNNYDLTFNNGTFTISQKAITITVTSGQTKVYGNDDPVLAYTITSGSLLDGHTFSGALARAVGINVGSYAINRGSLTILDGSSADVWDNYAVTWEWASLSITKRPITVTADPQTKVYGDDDPALTHQITSGSLAYSDVLSGSLSRVTGKDVGSYAINRGTLTIVDGSSANVEANYTLTYESSNLSITVRTLTLENFNADSKVYDGFTTATVTGTPFDDDRVTGDDLEFTYTTNFSDIHIGTNKDVDYTSIAISGGADKNNYTLASTTGTAKANISAKALTITAKDQIIPVGTSYVFDVNNDFEVDGLVNNGTDEVTSVSFDDSGVDYNVAAVYTDDIVPSNAVGTNLTNYTITYVNGDMDVTDLIQLSLSGLAAADKTYDGNRTATITSWGTIQGKTDDTHDVSVQTDPLPTIRFGDKSVDNNKTVTVSNIVLVGADAHHYFMPAQTTTANITQRDLELTGFTAQSKTFDGITDVSGEDFNDNRIADDVLTFSYTVEFEDRNSGVDKDVNFTDIAISGEADSGNYNLVTTTGVANASITPKELRLVAEEKSKQYGSDDPELTYTIHPDYGLVPTDDQSIITGAITRDSGEEVGGTYRVTQGTIAATNYNISFITAPFTITPRTLTLNSFSANSKVYDGTTSVPISQFTDDRIADELLEFDYDVVFEDVNVGVDKVVSFSNISISGGSHKDNYTLATTEGETNADITPKALSIFATPQSKVYGSALANASGYTEFTTQGLVNGESVASVSVNYADGNAADDAVGLYPDAIEIASAQPGTFNPSNYNITYVPGDLTVTFTETPENPHTINFGVDGGNGTISATVNGVPILSGTEVDEGQTVIFTATPAPGYVVSGWSQTSSTIEHTALTHTLSVTEDVTVNVSFAAQEANTSIVRFGVNGGNGTITASVDGTEIFDGNAVANGSTVIFTAQPDAGYVVDEWTQTGVTVEHTSIYHSVTVASDVAVSVSFAAQEANTSIVRFSVDGGNGTISASVNGAEIFDGNAVDNGSTVIFQAAPSANYVVDEWTQTGATVEHTSIYHSVTVASDVAVSVSFTAQEANTSIVRFSVNGGNGTLTATVNGIEIYDGNAVANGSTVIFQAAPSDGYVVDEWTQTGATVEHTSIYHSVTVASDVAVSVLFAAQEANTSIVRFSVNGGNGALTASVNGTEIFDGNAVANGSEVVFTAYPNDGYTIQSWVLNGSELNHLSNEYTCTVNEDISLTVAFAQQPEGTYIVNYSVISGSGSLVAKVNGEEILNGAAVEEDQEVIFMATPSEGYRLDEWIVNGSLLEHTELAYNHILNADVSVEVVFKDYGSTSIVANDDAAGTEYETPVTLNVLANDTELENEPIAVTIRTEPVSGTAIVNEDNSVTFSPANGFEGEATFTYTVTDAQGDSDWATVTITVLEDGATNHLPVTVSDSCATSYNTPVTIDVLYNDSGLEDEPITLTINSDIDVLEGTAAVDENNMVLFTPQTDFTGVVIFDYKVEDVHGDYSIASVKVNVKAGENFVPLANDDMVETKFNTSVEIDVLLNDLNLEDKPLALQIIENPTEGEAQINHDNNTIVYTPATDFVGEVLFEYMVVDVDGDWDSAQVSVTVTEVLNVTPVAYADSCGTSFNMPVTIDVLGNDINLNNAPITVTIVSDLDAFVGTAAVGDDNMVEFSPAEDFAGTANFTYRVTDIDGDYDEALVKVTVKEGNNFVPIAYDDSRGTSYNTPVKVDVLKNDINLNDEPIAVIVTEQSIPEQGNAVVNDDGTVEFTPATDYVGQATFTYRVIDIDGDYDDALVTITVKEGENFIPEAIDDVAFTHLQTPVEIDVLANDKHLDDTPVELYADAGQVENGTVEVLSNNSIRFIPADAFVGEASFTYRVTDAEGDFSEANVTIWVYAQVLAVDDEAELMRNDMVTIDVLANDKGLEEITPEISFSLLPVHGMVSVDSDNKLTYTPDYNYFGNDSLTYQVCSQYGSCSEAKVLINVKIEKFRIPEGFSPDGDGINDQFEILGLEVYQQVKIKIFNRWGHVVYQNADYKNNWDGKANAVMSIGKTLPNGTYFYVIEVVDTDERFSGNIFLKR